MQTLTFGFKKPEAGDQGTVLFDALADNVQKTNDHSHDGTDSPLLNSAALTVTTQNVPSAGWISLGAGTYRQQVFMAGGTQFDNVVVSFKEVVTGSPLMLTVEKSGPTSYWVYINDNTISLTALYGL